MSVYLKIGAPNYPVAIYSRDANGVEQLVTTVEANAELETAFDGELVLKPLPDEA